MSQRVFVAQPFSEPYSRRFDDTFKPAIEAAGFEAYRVDRDPGVSIPIDDIQNGIDRSAFVFADISEDNPNVWFEVGYAIALKKEICFVCSTDRFKDNQKFPFDVQHRSIITYSYQSKRDWSDLETRITERISAIAKRIEAVVDIKQNIKLRENTPGGEGLSEFELAGIAIVASSFPAADGISASEFKSEFSNIGYNNLAANMAVRLLSKNDMILLKDVHSQYDEEPHTQIYMTEFAWQFVERNRSLFVLQQKQSEPTTTSGANRRDLDDEIPF